MQCNIMKDFVFSLLNLFYQNKSALLWRIDKNSYHVWILKLSLNKLGLKPLSHIIIGLFRNFQQLKILLIAIQIHYCHAYSQKAFLSLSVKLSKKEKSKENYTTLLFIYKDLIAISKEINKDYFLECGNFQIFLHILYF